jgi:4-amino-4-deoxy-L-arabinose transferase-like glycosyltransferase
LRYVLLLWVALACGVLIKGPIIFLPVLCCIVFLSIYEKSPRWILQQRSHFIGIILFLCIALPWYILIDLKTDGAFFQEALGTDLSKKIVSSQESHGAPPGVFLLSTLGTFWPWTPILILSVVFLWKHCKERPLIFCAAWAIPAWILLELVPTKLPHYVLPLFPALAILTAYSLEKFGKTHWFGKVLFSVIGLTLVIAMVGAPKYFNETVHPISLVMSILAVAAIIIYCRRSNSIALFVAAWLVYTGMIAGTLAHLETPFVSTKLSKIINSCIPEQPFAIAGYHEPSLVFLTQTKIKLVTAEQAVALLQSNDVPLSFIPSNLEKPENTFAIANVTGLNYNGGDPVDLTGYAKNPDLCLETSSQQ